MKLDILDTDYLSSADAPAGGPLRAAYDSAMSLAPLSRCVLVSFTAAIVLLLLARAAIWALRTRGRTPSDNGMEKRQQGLEQSRRWPRYPGLKWDALPPLNLPVSLTMPRRPARGVGIGLASTTPAPQMAEAPLPARSASATQPKRKGSPNPSGPHVYQSEVPVSMAKIIMSRHTYRRPGTPRPTKRPVAPASAPSSQATPAPAPAPTNPQQLSSQSQPSAAPQQDSPADGPQDCMV
ncbi:hypothetical protein EV714DRAFT_271825 [Schizophyllum commune]